MTDCSYLSKIALKSHTRESGPCVVHKIEGCSAIRLHFVVQAPARPLYVYSGLLRIKRATLSKSTSKTKLRIGFETLLLGMLSIP